MEIILFLLGAIGFTDIVVNSVIMKPVREWFAEPYWPPVWRCIKLLCTKPIVWLNEYIITPISHMMGCPQCSGFWCGMLLGWLVLPNLTIWQVFAAGFTSSFLSVIASAYLNYLEAQAIIHIDEKGSDGH